MKTPILLLMAALGLLAIMSACSTSPKIGFVDNIKLYSEFKLQKVKTAEYLSIVQKQSSRLDSLASDIDRRIQSAAPDGMSEGQAKSFMIEQQDFLEKKQQHEEQSALLLQKYNEEIWNQLNEYIKSYGNAHGYEFVLGASGTGNVMHANADLDLTEDIIKYCNEKFSGEI